MLFSNSMQLYLSTETKTVPFVSGFIVIKNGLELVPVASRRDGRIVSNVDFLAITDDISRVFRFVVVSSVGRDGASECRSSYDGSFGEKRIDLEKEKVCLVRDLLERDWLMALHGITERRQNFYCITINTQ